MLIAVGCRELATSSCPVSDIIDPMNRGSYVLLVTGLLVGFFATYLVVRDRDLGPLVIRDAAPARSTVSGADIEDELSLIRQFEADLIERPNDFQLLVDLANLYFDTQDFQGAIAYYQRALAIRPDDANLRADLGTAFYYSSRFDRAVAEFETALALQPNHPQTLFNMGVLLLEQRDDSEGAIELWEHLLRTNPNYPQGQMIRTEIDRLRALP